MNQKVLYEEMCPQEFLEKIKKCPVAYLPLGTLEWHGPHLPLGADGIQSQELFIRVAEKIGGIVLPKLFLGPDRYFHDPNQELYGMDIYTGGTIIPYEMQQLPGSAYWMPDEQYQELIRRIAANLTRAGFKILVGHGHGPSIWQFEKMKTELKEKYDLICVTAFDFLQDEVFGYQCDHAAANETWITQNVRPDLVQMERILSGKEIPVGMAGKDPRKFGDENYGREIVEKNVEAMSKGLKEILTRCFQGYTEE